MTNSILDFSNIHTFALRAYKENPFLEEALLSLLNQKVKSTVIITTSTPNSYIQDIADKHNVPVYVATHESSVARDANFALSCCHTPYVSIPTHDDIYEADYTAKLLIKMLSNPEIVFAFCDANEIHKDGQKRRWSMSMTIKRILLFFFYIKNVWTAKIIKKTTVVFGCAIMAPSLMLHVAKIPEFRFDENALLEDWEAFYCLACQEGAFAYIPSPCFTYRLSDFQTSNVIVANGVREKGDKEMFHKMWPSWLANIFVKFYALNYKHYEK